MIVAAFVAQPSVEGFHKGILHRLPRRDVIIRGVWQNERERRPPAPQARARAIYARSREALEHSFAGAKETAQPPLRPRPRTRPHPRPLPSRRSSEDRPGPQPKRDPIPP
jgi:hypothetical protein